MHGTDVIQDLAIILGAAGVVGWVCRRLGLSVVFGYLAAGILVGPHRVSLGWVNDPGRIDTYAQVGLVFLMFGIGLRLSVRKLLRLGLPLMIAAVFGAITVFYLTRLYASALGFSAREGVFLAAITMVSSSAAIGRIVQEFGLMHERVGQLAIGVSLLEDVIAVVMLTLLGSISEFGIGGGSRATQSVLLLGAFIVLASVIGLLLVPWLLRRMSIAAGSELEVIGIAALLLGFAVITDQVGYSIALGAFLLGTIVAETMHRRQVERIFEGMRDVFAAVFFVAIGLKIDAAELWHQSGTILILSALTILVRTGAVAAGLVVVGTRTRDALRTGLTATPVGEFSFIIVQLGIANAVLPGGFFTLVVGVSVVTLLTAPLFTTKSDWITGRLLQQEPRWIRDWLAAYRGWLGRMHEKRSRNMLWQLSRKRIAQISIGMLFVTGLVVFSGKLLSMAEAWVGPEWLFPYALDVVFWTLLVLIALPPIVAIWRNLSSMALLFSQVSTRGNPRAGRLRPVVETVFKLYAAAGLCVWLLVIAPFGDTARWLLLTSGVIAFAAVLLLRRKLIYWHSEMEVELLSVVDTDDWRVSESTESWLQPHGDWNLQMLECALPDLADCQGKTLADVDLRARFGCTVVGIERQGFMIPLPNAATVLYAGDRVLLLGTLQQVRAGQACLSAVTGTRGSDSVFEEISLESMTVPAGSPAAGCSLGTLAIAETHGVQIAGIHRSGARLLNPGADEVLNPGDELLVLGTPAQNVEFKAWLRAPDPGAA